MPFQEAMLFQYQPLALQRRNESVNQAIREQNNSSEGVPINEFDEDLDFRNMSFCFAPLDLRCPSPNMVKFNESLSWRKPSSPASPRSSGDTLILSSPKWNSSSPFVPPPDIGIVTHTPYTNEGQFAGINARSPDRYLDTVNSGSTRSDELIFKELGPLNDSSVTALEPLTAFDGTQGRIGREAPIETRLVEALRYLEVQPNVGEILSTTNDWGQTLAHLSILHAYPSLLSHLVDWHINLTIADVNGLTALHYAYMKGDMDSVRTLRRGGASETVMDTLGLTPLDLLPEGFGAKVEEFDSDVD